MNQSKKDDLTKESLHNDFVRRRREVNDAVVLTNNCVETLCLQSLLLPSFRMLHKHSLQKRYGKSSSSAFPLPRRQRTCNRAGVRCPEINRPGQPRALSSWLNDLQEQRLSQRVPLHTGPDCWLEISDTSFHAACAMISCLQRHTHCFLLFSPQIRPRPSGLDNPLAKSWMLGLEQAFSSPKRTNTRLSVRPLQNGNDCGAGVSESRKPLMRTCRCLRVHRPCNHRSSSCFAFGLNALAEVDVLDVLLQEVVIYPDRHEVSQPIALD